MATKKKIVEKTTAKVETKTPSTKGTDAGTQYSHWTKNPHGVEANIVEVKGGKVNTYKKAGSVYTADFKVIDDTIEEIKLPERREKELESDQVKDLAHNQQLSKQIDHNKSKY